MFTTARLLNQFVGRREEGRETIFGSVDQGFKSSSQVQHPLLPGPSFSLICPKSQADRTPIIAVKL